MNKIAQNIIAKLHEGLADLNDVETEEVTIGTVEHPLYRPRGFFVGEDIVVRRPVLTGKRARQQVGDLFKKLQQAEDPDIALPVSSRQARRSFAAGQRRARRKGQRAYVRSERAKERAANDLAHIFNVLDGHIKVDEVTRRRFQNRLEARIAYLHDEQLAAALKADDDRDVATREEIITQLRALAKTAPTPLVGSARVKAGRAVK